MPGQKCVIWQFDTTGSCYFGIGDQDKCLKHHSPEECDHYGCFDPKEKSPHWDYPLKNSSIVNGSGSADSEKSSHRSAWVNSRSA